MKHNVMFDRHLFAGYIPEKLNKLSQLYNTKHKLIKTGICIKRISNDNGIINRGR